VAGVKTVAVVLVVSLLASPVFADAETPAPEVTPGPSAETAVSQSDVSQSEPQEVPTPEPTPPPSNEPPQEPAPPKEPPPKRPSLRPKDFWKDVKVEAKRYVADSYAIATAPIHWSGADWTRFGGVVLVVGGLMLADKSIDREMQQNRSRFTNRVADATTGFGGGYGPNVGVGFLLTGYVLRDWNVRETGREILEAGFLSHLLDKYVLKPTFGRERPFESDGETRFHFFSSHDSFPSGHATEAFSIASVVAMRSKGWVLPTVAYTAATLVCFDRVNDHVHFASDVVAGAVLGTAVGRFIVARHRRAQEQKPTAEFDVVPIRGGLAARLAF
jgi:membrane-associated phospholipid phosphatase